MLIVKTRQRWVAVCIWCTFGVAITAWLTLRKAGFSTSYIRCHYLIMLGDYKQILEAGTTPANVFLPPHLRLDQHSYLDHPDTEIAVPPEVDMSLQTMHHITSLEGAIPKSERTDIHGHIGPFRTHSIVMSAPAAERYVNRRLGPSDSDRAKLESERAASK